VPQEVRTPVSSTWLAIASAVIVALLSSTLTYLTTRRLHGRADRLAQVTKQISELYGPLHALSRASEASWVQFRNSVGPDKAIFGNPRVSLGAEEVAAWKYWITYVFMPLNRKMFEVILDKTHLIEGEELPACLVDFCAHVNGYEVTLARWEAEDYSVLGSLIDHPGSELHDYLSGMYRMLKQKQGELLAR
jgi:hypothetical protein